jgi:hypothetical protein
MFLSFGLHLRYEKTYLDCRSGGQKAPDSGSATLRSVSDFVIFCLFFHPVQQHQQALHTLAHQIQLSAQPLPKQQPHLMGKSPRKPSSTPSPVLQSPPPSSAPSAIGADNPQEAISAIVHSLASAAAQFKQRKLDNQQGGSAIGRQPEKSSSPAAQLLPTVPVPAASLVDQRLSADKVTVVGAPSSPPDKLARPIQTSSAQSPTNIQAVGIGGIASPRRLLNHQPSPSDGSGPQTTLHALLITEDTKPQKLHQQGLAAGVSLLERLVTSGSNLNPLANELPCVQQVHNCGSSPSSSGLNPSSGGSDITLAALLANPLPHQNVGGPTGNDSPTQISPLLPQLLQPVQTVHQQQQTRARLSSPPQEILPIQPVQSPRGGGGGSLLPSPHGGSAQVMQSPRYPATTKARTRKLFSAKNDFLNELCADQGKNEKVYCTRLVGWFICGLALSSSFF